MAYRIYHKQRIRSAGETLDCRLEETMAVDTVVQDASDEAHNRNNTLAQDTGRRRLFEHMRDQGEQVETLWESGKTIRHLAREEGQDT